MKKYTYNIFSIMGTLLCLVSIFLVGRFYLQGANNKLVNTDILIASIVGVIGVLTIVVHFIISSNERRSLVLITESRIRWINELKGLIVIYMTTVKLLRDSKEGIEIKVESNLERKVFEVQQSIKMQLDPVYTIDFELIDKMEKVTEKLIKSTYVSKYLTQYINELDEDFMLYLKCEWQKVKFESKYGTSREFDFSREFLKLKGMRKKIIDKLR